MNSENPIGIFDSGIGGVTVLKEISKILPNENYIYYSDSLNNPYGDKSDNTVNKLCDNIIHFFIEKKCKAIIIACNTASAKSAQYLRKKYSKLPFVVIEPAYKMVYDYSYNNPTLVMATKGTIESKKFNTLYHKYDNHNTKLLPCVGLADIIENGDKLQIKNYLQHNLAKYKGKVKNVVLGCTHYPLIENEIKEVLGNVCFFNGAPYLAKHLKTVLIENNLINTKRLNGNISFFDSNNSEVKKNRFFSYIS